MGRGAWRVTVHGVARVRHDLVTRLPPYYICRFPGGSVVKNLPANAETWIRSLGWEDALEKEMATHPSILAWEVSGTEEPGKLQSMGSE